MRAALLLLLLLAGCEHERVVEIDITEEIVCMNDLLTEPSGECQTHQGCDQMCRERVCDSYGLDYKTWNLTEERCVCLCIDKGKMRQIGKMIETPET